MIGRVLILDTSVLCCFLRVPGKDTAGPRSDLWTHDRVAKLLREEEIRRSTFVLPLASIIETGNHIAQCPSNRYEIARQLALMIENSANKTSPWAAFTDQADLWGSERLVKLASEWPKLAAASLSIGDATIKDVAEYYSGAGYTVEIVTGDQGLKSYEPAKGKPVPRRRR